MKKQTLEDKKKELKELSALVVLKRGMLLTKEQNQTIENFQHKSEFRLKELLERVREEEVDIKLGIIKEMVKYIKGIKDVQKV